MKTNLITTALAAMLMIAGCKAQQPSATAAYDAKPAVKQQAMSPEELGKLGAEIQKSPNEAHKLIEQHGLTEETFAAAVRKTSEDPAAAKRYAAAYKQARG
jgi:hypothetical protein